MRIHSGLKSEPLEQRFRRRLPAKRLPTPSAPPGPRASKPWPRTRTLAARAEGRRASDGWPAASRRPARPGARSESQPERCNLKAKGRWDDPLEQERYDARPRRGQPPPASAGVWPAPGPPGASESRRPGPKPGPASKSSLRGGRPRARWPGLCAAATARITVRGTVTVMPRTGGGRPPRHH